MNIFDALNIFYREDTISDFLVNCFKDSNQYLNKFLQAADIMANDDAVFHIETRVSLGKNIGTPDIVIRFEKEDIMHFIIIENKMGASEGIEQTDRYESPEAREKIASKYNADIKNSNFHFVFLALDVTAEPKNSQFHFITYEIFTQGEWTLQTEVLQIIFKDFQKKLIHFYEPLKEPYESLDKEIKISAMQRKICWQKVLFRCFQSDDRLHLTWGEALGQGRSNFIFLITKPTWKSTRSFREDGLSKNFYVHIDTYVNMLDEHKKGVKDIGIRFETFPYEPHRKIEDLVGYELFKQNKSVFSEMLYEKTRALGISVKRKNSKLLVMSLPIEGSTARQTVQNIKNGFDAIEKCIDEVIDVMKMQNLLK